MAATVKFFSPHKGVGNYKISDITVQFVPCDQISLLYPLLYGVALSDSVVILLGPFWFEYFLYIVFYASSQIIHKGCAARKKGNLSYFRTSGELSQSNLTAKVHPRYVKCWGV